MTLKPETRFTLPDRNTMANALVAVDGEGHLVRYLYPQILKHAGQEQAPTGFAFFLSLEIVDYADRLNLAPLQRNAVILTTNMLIEKWGRALIKDETAREEFLDVLAQVGLPTGR
jgi:hypothetical protein